jgi:phage-related protein
MSDYVGTATIQLRASDKQLNSDLNQAETTTKSKLSGIAKAGAATVAAIAAKAVTEATATVVAISKKSTELYAAFEQSVGGTETLFKDAADEVLGYADKAFETAGISANDYLEQVNSLAGALMQSTGENAAEAAKLADRAMQSISDNSAKIGTDITMVQNAYQSLARGQFMLLDNLKLGYGGTRGEMERLIADASQMTDEMEKLGVTVDATSMDFGNMVNAIAVVQEHMGIAGTTVNEAYETISGSMKMAKAAASDFVRGLADPNADIGALFDNLMTGVAAFAKNIGKTIMRLLPNITKAIKMLLDEVAKALPGLIQEVVPLLTDTIMDVTTVLLNNGPAILNAAWSAILYAVNSIIAKLPEFIGALTNTLVGIVQALFTGNNLRMLVQAALGILTAFFQALPQIITTIVGALPDIITGIVDFLTNPDTIMMLMEASLQLFMAIVACVPQILPPLFEAFINLISTLWTTLQSNLTGFFTDFGKGIGNIFIRAINQIITWIEDAINGPINAINGALDALNSVPGININHISTIQFGRLQELATGGVVNRATPAIIGEAGKEAVIPLERDNGWAKAIAGQLATAFESEDLSGGRTINIYMTNTIESKLDIDEVSRELVTSIRRAI